MITSETDIANIALTRCGHNQITSLSDNVKGADLCRLHYSMCRDAVLRAFPWNFAIKRVALAALTDTPSHEYTYVFPLPSDCLKVIRTDGEAEGYTDVDYRIEGRNLLTNDDAVSIEYIARITDVSQFDDLFVDVLASRLAADIAMSLTDNAALAKSLLDIYQVKLLEARTIDSQEGTPRQVINTTAWITARL